MKKTVILFSGKMRSGKNLSADYLFNYLKNNQKTYEHLFFAKSLKDNCKQDFTLLQEYLNNYTLKMMLKYNLGEEFSKDISKLIVSDENYYEDKTDITRILLQVYGTEIFRNRVNTNYWVDKVIEQIKESDKQYFVITDLRFPNEIDYFKEAIQCIYVDVNSIRINRDSVPENNHISETALDNYDDFDYVVYNNSTIEDLHSKLDKIIKEIV